MTGFLPKSTNKIPTYKNDACVIIIFLMFCKFSGSCQNLSCYFIALLGQRKQSSWLNTNSFNTDLSHRWTLCLYSNKTNLNTFVFLIAYQHSHDANNHCQNPEACLYIRSDHFQPLWRANKGGCHEKQVHSHSHSRLSLRGRRYFHTTRSLKRYQGLKLFVVKGLAALTGTWLQLQLGAASAKSSRCCRT